MTIRVLVADDHPIFLAGLKALFHENPEFELVELCMRSDEVVRAITRHNPDVVVLDKQMPQPDAFAIARELSTAGPPTRIVLLTASIDDEEMIEAVRLGIRGVLLKEMTPRLLLDCIRRVHAGGEWLEKTAVAHALEKIVTRDKALEEVQTILTRRELELVCLVARGFRNKEIGTQLDISEGTVKMHLNSVFRKLKVSSRVELTLFAREKGLT